MMLRFKKVLAILLIAVFSLMLAACSDTSDPKKESGGLEPIPADPIYEGSSLADSPFVGSFRCSWSALYASSTDDISWQGKVSELTVSESGDFTLTFNSMEAAGMVTVSGSVSVKDDTALCTVESRSGSAYLGEEVSEFSLQLINENELRYIGEQQGAACGRDIYTREG